MGGWRCRPGAGSWPEEGPEPGHSLPKDNYKPSSHLGVDYILPVRWLRGRGAGLPGGRMALLSAPDPGLPVGQVNTSHRRAARGGSQGGRGTASGPGEPLTTPGQAVSLQGPVCMSKAFCSIHSEDMTSRCRGRARLEPRLHNTRMCVREYI